MPALVLTFANEISGAVFPQNKQLRAALHFKRCDEQKIPAFVKSYLIDEEGSMHAATAHTETLHSNGYSDKRIVFVSVDTDDTYIVNYTCRNT